MNFRNLVPLNITSYGWMIFVAYWIFAGLKTKRTIKRENAMARIVYLILMILAFELIYARIFARGFLARRWIPESKTIDITGIIINLSGIAFAITARSWLGTNWSGAVTVKKDHELIRTGPYAITRHPIYTGML
ncbi:MAG: methyltransferase family protein, partial [Chitinophagales bacterium]